MSSSSLSLSTQSSPSFPSSSSSFSSTSSASCSSNSSSTPATSSIFTRSFAQSTSSRLSFSSFPPANVPRSSIDDTSFDVAIALLHDPGIYMSMLNPLITENHEVLQCSPGAGNIDPIQLLAEFSDTASSEMVSGTMSTRSPSTESLSTSDWKYYTVADIVPLLVRFIKPKTTYHVALRLTADGIESLTLRQNYFILHSTLRIESRGSSTDEKLSGETLWLVEAARVRCWRGLSWYMEKNMAESRKLMHERFRVGWDRGVLDTLKRMRRKDSGYAM